MKDEQYIFKKFLAFRDSIDPECDPDITERYPQFVIYRYFNDENDDCYFCKCSACKEVYTVPKKQFRRDKIKHNAVGVCANCGESVKFIAAGKVPVSSYSCSHNFVVVNACDNDVYLSCVAIRQHFSDELGHDWDEISDCDVVYTVSEKQRYYLSADGALKWNATSPNVWTPVKRFSEPHFMSGGFSYSSCYYYTKTECLSDSFLRYCCVNELAEYMHEHHYGFPFVTYLHKAAKYPILEKLIKSGFEEIVARWLTNNNGPKVTFRLKAETVQKALGLNSEELAYIRSSDDTATTYRDYVDFRKKLKGTGSFFQRMEKFERFRGAVDNIVEVSRLTGLSHEKVMGYIGRQMNGQGANFCAISWKDYLGQCKRLDYDITDTAISKPKDLWESHDRLTKLVSNKEDAVLNTELVSRIERRRWLEYDSGRFVVIQPQTVGEIIVEGQRLNHCVGEYAEDHATGRTNIMFLRTKARPWKPFYTIEVDNLGHIEQCRGYGNNLFFKHGVPKPQEIKDFEAEYQKHLYRQFKKKLKKARITA